MTGRLRAISDVLPLTYAVDPTQHIAASPQLPAALLADLAVVAGAAAAALLLGAAALLLGAATLRRRTP